MKMQYVGDPPSNKLVDIVRPGWIIVVAAHASTLNHYVSFHYQIPDKPVDSTNNIQVYDSLHCRTISEDVKLKAEGLHHFLINNNLVDQWPLLVLDFRTLHQTNLHDCGRHVI
jgi:hypothetical protein